MFQALQEKGLRQREHRFMSELYAHIISYDWQKAVLAFDIGQSGFAEIEILNSGTVMKSEEAVGSGRFYLEGLPASTCIEIEFRSPAGEKHLSFTTLPEPVGDMLCEFALIADPHISTKKENRKGRFFVESAALADDVINRCAELNIAHTIWAGDITNAGLEGEYILSEKVLRGLPQAPWLIPGNHDHNPELWSKYFGERRWVRDLPGFGKVIGIDTSDKILHPEDAAVIERELDNSGRVVIVSHYQLFESPDINHVPAASVLPNNIMDYAALLEKLADTPSLIYVGHQNIMSVTPVNKAVQINLPQPPQYPCGWIRVRCFANGIYYTFEPIASEVLRQWSRRAGEEAAVFYEQSQWQAAYRRGRFPESGNFFQEKIN